LIIHLHLVPRSKNEWSYTSIPQYAFMAWCSVLKKSTGTTLLLPLLDLRLAVYILCNQPTFVTQYSIFKRMFVSFLEAFVSVPYCYTRTRPIECKFKHHTAAQHVTDPRGRPIGYIVFQTQFGVFFSSFHCRWATGWTIWILGFDSRRRLGIFLFTTASRTALGPTQPPIQWVPGALSLGVKRPGR
jgi:hypothetical protein